MAVLMRLVTKKSAALHIVEVETD